MKKPLIIGIGELFGDILPEICYVGGTPANVVYHAAKQGADAFLVSAVGDDVDGYELRAELGRKGICEIGNFLLIICRESVIKENGGACGI